MTIWRGTEGYLSTLWLLDHDDDGPLTTSASRRVGSLC